LARDLPWGEDAPLDPAAAVGSCMAAIEIIEDRAVDYAILDTPTLAPPTARVRGAGRGRTRS
jgi:hypothetical protein